MKFDQLLILITEENNSTISFNELMTQLDNEPEEYVYDYFGVKDRDIQLPIKYMDAKNLLVHEQTIATWTKRLNKHSKEIVSDWRSQIGKNDIPPIILARDNILDGCHRAMAFYLSKTEVPYISVYDLP